MANTLNSSYISFVRYGDALFGDWDGRKKNPFEVRTYRRGDYVCVSANGFYEEIKMKDKWWWTFSGKTWEGEVRVAQRKAFETAYLLEKEREIKDYQVGRLN